MHKTIIFFFLLIASSWCLLRVPENVANTRIIGGQEAFAGQFPWVAAIYLTTDTGNYFCGGTILNVLYVLTAGQCVDGATLFTILLGTNELQGNNNTVRVATEIYFLHPDYNPTTLEHDVGLIRFRIPVTFSDYIGSVTLVIYPSTGGASATALGWGQVTDEGAGLVNNLNYVQLTLLSSDECKIYYGSQIADTMICAIGQYNEGTCIGDTGAPLVENYRNMVYMIVGISSFVSSNGCESTNPSGFTRTYEYTDWIYEVMSPDSEPIAKAVI